MLAEPETAIPFKRSSVLNEIRSSSPPVYKGEEGETEEGEEEKRGGELKKKNLSTYLKALTESESAVKSPEIKNKHVLSLQRVNEATEDVQNMDTMSEFKNVKLSKIQSPSLLAQTLRTKHHLKELFRN